MSLLKSSRLRATISKHLSEVEMTNTSDKILIEYLGFSPISFIDKILNLINLNLYDFIKEFETQLKTENQSDFDDLNNGCAAIETLMERSIDSKFDKWELYCLKNILCLPKGTNVASLPHYKDLNLKVTNEDHDMLDNELAQLRMQRIAERWKRIQLEKKQSMIQARQTQMNELNSQLQHAKTVAVDAGVYPVDAKTQELKEMLVQVNQKVSGVEERTSATNWTAVPLIGTDDVTFDLARSVESEVMYHLNKAALAPPTGAKVSAWDVTRDFRDASSIGSSRNIESVALLF